MVGARAISRIRAICICRPGTARYGISTCCMHQWCPDRCTLGRPLHHLYEPLCQLVLRVVEARTELQEVFPHMATHTAGLEEVAFGVVGVRDAQHVLAMPSRAVHRYHLVHESMQHGGGAVALGLLPAVVDHPSQEHEDAGDGDLVLLPHQRIVVDGLYASLARDEVLLVGLGRPDIGQLWNIVGSCTPMEAGRTLSLKRNSQGCRLFSLSLALPRGRSSFHTLWSGGTNSGHKHALQLVFADVYLSHLVALFPSRKRRLSMAQLAIIT